MYKKPFFIQQNDSFV